MSELFNPYAVSVLGSPLPQKAPPQLRAEGRPMTRPQLDMARFVFGRFLEQARLSYVPNPTQHGFLPDGSRFRIIDVAGSMTMQVWPVGEDEVRRPIEIQHGILFEYPGDCFIFVQFDLNHPDGARWVAKKIRSGYCGASFYKPDVKPGKNPEMLAISNYGEYDVGTSLPMKFDISSGLSEFRSCGSGYFTINGAYFDFSKDGVVTFLDTGHILFAGLTGVSRQYFTVYLLRMPSGDYENDQSVERELERTHHNEPFIGYTQHTNGLQYGRMRCSPKRKEVTFYTKSELLHNGVNDPRRTGFCAGVFSGVVNIPAHRLDVTKTHEYEVSAVIGVDDSAQKAFPTAVVEYKDIAHGVRSRGPISGTMNFHYEGGYSRETSSTSLDVAANYDGSERKTLTMHNHPLSYSVDINNKIEQEELHEDSIYLTSYYDFNGNRKEINIISKIEHSMSAIYKEREFYPARVQVGTMGHTMSLTTYEFELTNRELQLSTEIKNTYKGTANIGGNLIEIANIEAVCTLQPSDMGDIFVGANVDEMQAEVLSVIYFEEKSETLVAINIRMTQVTGKGYEFKIYDFYGNIYSFYVTMKFQLSFVVYAKGTKVFEEELAEFIGPLGMKVRAPDVDIRAPVPYVILDSWSNTTTVTDGDKPGTINSYNRYSQTYSGNVKEYKAIIMKDYAFLFHGADPTERIINSAQIDKHRPKTMIAVDPISGGCAVVNNICKILIDPKGGVTQIRDVTKLPDSLLNEWCASI